MAATTVVAPRAQFFIPATASLQERRPRTLKHGDTFAVFDPNGDAIAGPGSPEGVFHRDTRHLSHLYLTIDDVRPMLLSSTLRDDNATLTCDLTNPDLLASQDRLALEHDLIHLRRSRFLWNGACHERLAIRNFDDRRHRITVSIGFAADFADLFEVRGVRREQRGEALPPVLSTDRVTLAYRGLDGLRRQTVLRFDPVPTILAVDHARFVLDLAPKQAHTLVLEISFGTRQSDLAPRQTFLSALRSARRALRASSSRAAAIESSNDIFNEAIRRSISDLYMLITDKPEGPYPYAGIPWFSTVFGRDALITALETLWVDPLLARGVLRHLAANQATALDPGADAEPGKILHEMRYGEMAELREVPFQRYYGSIDSTPLFVMLAGAYWGRTGDVATVQALWPHVEAALGWIDAYGDRDGDGFIEYDRMTDGGLRNQGWKDSHDSIFHQDGRLAEAPIALAEVQAYTYGAFRAAASLARALGKPTRASELDQRADRLRATFDQAFFDEELGTYVLALDGNKRPCRVRASNAGHVLLTGLACSERAPMVVRTLMAPEAFCGWGVRTVATSAARYNPMSYHNGSVWPHDNALIAAGLARYGFKREAARIFEGLFDASTYIDLRRLPELFCGFARQGTQAPTFYPVACTPQAWAAAAPLLMLQACLGLSLDAKNAQVTFDEPILPRFLDEIKIRHLALDGESVSVSLKRSGRHVVVDVLERKGVLRVLTRT
ncbi:amylo-alpha-1,6-glucosidase (plasmid) [Marinivivus vitaminiproducens]|nr:amylo-alpha-1,6-glucosidase [Geminicoccaceae bacterium SCSIO 64248]